MANVVRLFDPKELQGHPEKFFRQAYVWELPVRLTHWVTGISIVVLFLTGLYIGHPILAPTGEPAHHFVMGRVRQVHFAAALIFIVSFLFRIYWFWVGNNYARSGFPCIWRAAWWREIIGEVIEYVKLRRGRAYLGHNALGGASYTFFIVLLGWFQIFTGLALYSEVNPGGLLDRLFGWVIPLLGGSYKTHMYHHLVAWAFPIFVLMHVYVVLYDAVTLGNGLVGSIVSGHKFYQREDVQNDK
jgi:Ni/Fe-hydrogenase 1 B-type cytochrome subunit